MDNPGITTTDFKFPDQASLYHGKVRDVYSFPNDLLISVATDRISAFDVILPKPVPFKGQVLNQIAAHFLDKTRDIVPNWLQAVPDPNVSAGVKAQPVKIEMVIRGCLVGHAWREYSSGKRQLCGVALPEGMKEYDPFPEAILTPTTKADVGHDEDIDEKYILENDLASAEEWKQLSDYTSKLFARGQEMARSQGLVLADTKYEFGTANGEIILIDEVHTPDSSRYFYADSYDDFVAGKSTETPKQLSKEFVREWLMENGFSGQNDQQIPEMTESFIKSVTERYVELYEKMVGEKFEMAEADDVLKRIETNIATYLETST
jgi:phosphoribosylaminoimidazole-succinocarboxamide synthase